MRGDEEELRLGSEGRGEEGAERRLREDAETRARWSGGPQGRASPAIKRMK